MIVRNDPKTLRSGLILRWARARNRAKAEQLMIWVLGTAKEEADENS